MCNLQQRTHEVDVRKYISSYGIQQIDKAKTVQDIKGSMNENKYKGEN